MRPTLAVLLAALLPLVTGAQSGPVAPQPEPTNSPQNQEVEGAQPAQEVTATDQQPSLEVDPGLVNKKVVVRLRDGRTVKGKLVQVADDSLHLKVDGRTERIAVPEVARVERQRRGWVLPVVVAGAVAGTILAVFLVALAAGEPD